MKSQICSKRIGQTINKVRKHREVKAAEIAAHLKITEQAYTKYERGETQVSFQFLNKVAAYLNVEPVMLILHGPETIIERLYEKKSD